MSLNYGRLPGALGLLAAALLPTAAWGAAPFRRAGGLLVSQERLREFPGLPFETDLRRHFPSEPRRSFRNARLDRANGVTLGRGAEAARPGKRQRPVIWVHVHKAGGTFMCSMAQAAGEHIVQPSDGACNWLGHDQYKDSGKLGVKVSCSDRKAFFLGSGGDASYTWGQIEREFKPEDRCYSDFDYGVMLREPIALMHSEMNYHPRCWPTWPAWLFPDCGSGPNDPQLFMRELWEKFRSPGDEGGDDQFPAWKFFDNFQIRILAPALSVPAGGINATHLEAAKRTLLDFQVVARLEDLPTHGEPVFHKLGWSSDMMNHVGAPVNANPHDSELFTFSAEGQSWLRKINKWDLALYEFYAPAK